MQIECLYAKTFSRDEYTGDTLFTVSPAGSDAAGLDVNFSYGTIMCRGKIQPLPPKTPLELEIVPTQSKRAGNIIYEVTSYRFSAKNYENVKSFISSKLFDGVGEKIAAKVLDAANGDIFSFASREDGADALIKQGISEKTAMQVTTKIKHLVITWDVMKIMSQLGCPYQMSSDIVAMFGIESLKYVNESPYELYRAGIPFNVCEHLGAQHGISKYDNARIVALIETAIKEIVHGGSTKDSISSFLDRCDRIESRTNANVHTPYVYILGELLEDEYPIIREAGKYYVYSKRMFQIEKDIATDIKKLSVSFKHKPIKKNEIDEIQKNDSIEYSEEQKEAFGLLSTPGVKILTGGPGTGKTTVVNGIIKAYSGIYPDAIIKLCAPTGCAAKRLSEATGRKAETIHKLLELNPGNAFASSQKGEFNKIQADLLIVDESSMLDTEIFGMLLKAVKPGATMILVGDEDQLPSVGAGNILHDLLKINEIQRVRLKKVYRQKSGSLIIENSIRIREGRSDLLSGKGYEIYHTNSTADMKKQMEMLIRQYYDPNLPNKTKIYCPSRREKFAISTITFNRIMHDMYNRGGTMDRSVIYNGVTFTVGDPVIFIENNYRLGFYNGETGVIREIIYDGYKKLINVDKEGRNIQLTESYFGQIELAYSLTMHKAQGSECDVAIILLPTEPRNMLDRSLVYVASTRAKEKNILIYQDDALQTAVQTVHSTTRMTGLRERVSEAFFAA